MRVMKDSGVEWIGKIPDSWSVSRLKYCAVLNPKCDFSHLPADAYVTFTPMELVGYGDFQNNAESLEKLSGAYTPFQDGDIALAKVTPCFENGKIAIMTGLHSGVGFGSSELFVIRAVEINTKFLFYFLQNEGFKDVACSTMTGTGGLKRVSPDFVHNCPIAIPSLTEQQRIAAYLDDQCGEIDKVLAKTRESIEEYKKLKQSVITEAVTKGIRPNRPMKPNGIEWIGDIPAEWEVVKLKRLAKIETGNTPPKNSESIFFSRESGYLWIKAENLGSTKSIEETTEYLTEEGIKHGRLFPAHSVFVCCIASVGKVGFCSKAASCNQQINALSFINAHWKYGFYLTVAQETEYLLYASGNVMKIINSEKQSNLMCPLPQLAEQAEIVAYLDQQCAEIDRLIAKKEQIITELESYKKSLIYECVTGKREVE